MPVRTHVRLFAAGALAAAAAAVPALGLAAPAGAAPESRACPPAALALGYRDALDKADFDGVTVGGLSELAYDRRRTPRPRRSTTTAPTRRGSGSSATSPTRGSSAFGWC